MNADKRDQRAAAAIADSAIGKLRARAEVEGLHPFVRRNLIECADQIETDARAIILAPAPQSPEEGTANG
jgi:hypothetical protein